MFVWDLFVGDGIWIVGVRCYKCRVVIVGELVLVGEWMCGCDVGVGVGRRGGEEE